MPGSLVPLFPCGDGPKPVPIGCHRSWGEGERRALMVYALQIATATKWVPWPDFTRIKTLRLPSF